MRKIIKLLSCLIPVKKWRVAFRNKFAPSETRYMKKQKKYNLGKYSYMSYNSTINNPKSTVIGSYTSIGKNTFIGVSCHPIDRISMHPFTYRTSCKDLYGDLITPEDKVIPRTEDEINPPVHVGNDVWIGANVVVIVGVTIGVGAVVGAGAVVTKDVEPYTIVLGVPARPYKKRFSQEIIDKLLELKWWDYLEDFVVNMPFDNVEECIKLMEENRHLVTNKGTK